MSELTYDFEPTFNEVTKNWEFRGTGQLLSIGSKEILAKNDKQTPFVVGNVKYVTNSGVVTKPTSCIMFVGILDNNEYKAGETIPLTIVPNENQKPLVLLGITETRRASMDDFDLSALEAAKNAVINDKKATVSK